MGELLIGGIIFASFISGFVAGLFVGAYYRYIKDD